MKGSVMKFIVALFVITFTMNAQSMLPDQWTTNSQVNAIVYDSTTGIVYIGGSFSHIGPYTGGFALIDPATGDRDTTIPDVAGWVYSIAYDSSGGWYVGGLFSKVGGVACRNLAHILPDGSLDLSWNPSPNNTVYSIAVATDRVLIGGDFDTVGSTAQKRLASFDRTTGELQSWNPGTNSTVYSLLIKGNSVYAGGAFTIAGDSTRKFLASFDISTGLITSWKAEVDNTVWTMTASDTVIYFGGSFTYVNSTARNRLAAVDISTGALKSWNPNSNNTVYTMQLKDTLVYVGGAFDQIGSSYLTYIAAVHWKTGLCRSWYPILNSTVRCMAISGDTIHLGGMFTTAEGGEQYRYASYLRSTKTKLSASPVVSTTVFAMASGPSGIAIGGWFNIIGGEQRLFLAALNAATKTLLPWKMTLNGAVQSIAVTDSLIIIGGSFTKCSGLNRNHLASFDKSKGGELTDWNPSITRSSGAVNIFSLVPSGNTLFIGGQFDAINLIARDNIAKIPLTGSGYPFTDWIIDPYGVVYDMVLMRSNLYFVGSFTTPYTNAAKADTASGWINTWNPNPNSGSDINVIKVVDSLLYVGGNFGTIGGLTRYGIAALDTSTGIAKRDFDANSPSIIKTIAREGSTLYIGGGFTSVGGAPRTHLAAVDVQTGAVKNWSVSVSTSMIEELAVISGKVYVGWPAGYGYLINGQLRPFAVLEHFDEPVPVELNYLNAITAGNSATLYWNTSTEVNNYGFDVERRKIENGKLKNTNWERISFIKGNGTSNVPREYSFTDSKLTSGRYEYRLKQIDNNGSFKYSQSTEIEIAIPREFALEQNYPNPFNPSTVIGYSLPVNGLVSLKVFDILGREVATLVNEVKEKGSYEIQFNTSNLTSGIYFYRIQTGSFTAVRKMVLMK